VFLVQLAAAFLLLLGSGLVFRALLELDKDSHPRLYVRPRPGPADDAQGQPLDRAA
jgi:hypothetical protein